MHCLHFVFSCIASTCALLVNEYIDCTRLMGRSDGEEEALVEMLRLRK